MKKIGILLAMCLLLAGCGSEDVASVPAGVCPRCIRGTLGCANGKPGGKRP